MQQQVCCPTFGHNRSCTAFVTRLLKRISNATVALCRRTLLELKQSRLVLVILLSLLLLTQDWIGIVLYCFTVPYSQFTYPLEIDLRALVDEAESIGKLPSWSPPAINNPKFPLLHLNAARCKGSISGQQQQRLNLLIIVKSSVPNFQFRSAVRSTWVQQTSFGANFTVQHAFVLGAATDPKLQQKVRAEQQEYGDIVQHGLIDSYYNNTLKLMFAFKWIARYCSRADHILFADDDYYVSPSNIRRLLHGRNPSERWIIGFVFERPIPKRSPTSKWRISLSEYPFTFWPPYPTGGAFIVSKRMCLSISIAQRFVKYLRFDDVFVGIVLKKLHLKPEHHAMFYHEFTLPFTHWMYTNAMAVHLDKQIHLLFELWKLMNYTVH